MKKSIFSLVFAFVSFAFTANAQSCCSSKAKDKTTCGKKTATTEKATNTNEANSLLVPKLLTNAEKNEKFIVYGNCGMCKRTIENSLKDVKGVSKGDWDIESGVMTIIFNPEKITLHEIKQKIAEVGYDTDSHRAKDDVYGGLPGCCQYERPE